jgi:hypothetical protein
VSVTKKWAAQRKAEERSENARLRRRQSMTAQHSTKLNAAASRVMETAYLKASDGGRLFANARQIMYAARPLVLELTGGKCWSDDSYFTQQLLPNHIAANDLDDEWKVAYDARGHLIEPKRFRVSGGQTVTPLGTLEVMRYAEAAARDPLTIDHLPLDFPTAGPLHRYSAVVFVEKEGFDQQIEQSGLADRYDVAFMSTKGMSNVASRKLIDYLAEHDVRVMIVRDFDRAGFSIAGTLTTTSRRYTFRNGIDVVDLGLRLVDVESYGLDSEPWSEKVSRSAVTRTLRRHGATEDEIGFLVEGGDPYGKRTWGRRVELNALTSAQFIEWLEAKLVEHGIEKVVPDEDTLALQYRRATARHAVNRKIDEIAESVRAEAARAVVPADLATRVRGLLADDPSASWDEAVARIAGVALANAWNDTDGAP